MGQLGGMFPGPRIRDESSEAGDGEQPWQLGPIDLEHNTVVLHRADVPAPPAQPAVDASAQPDDGASGAAGWVPRG